ncbi:uncharacterized protein [Triticum aestivum]|uniref:uncharacterized protein n=2 Tax=Triticum aestivum TaxID=4565 RepID=UPI001D006A53|nr:uncharacterized protein LOC123050328 [Triticum aestivum]XP_044329077.1 uncharacterized protein LOC123050328 [Triticum aestivum]
MGRPKKKPEYLKEKADKAKEAAKALAREKVAHLVQSSCEDIPVFPYGYNAEKRPPDWVTAPAGLNREKFIEDYLSKDYLPANATQQQFENLYGQLHQYHLSISPHSLESNKKCNIRPEIVVGGKLIPEEKHDGTPVTSYLDKNMKNTYHIIRVWDARKKGRFLEFLRQNCSGYVLAWRVYALLVLFKSAKWCYFSDEPAIVVDLGHIWTFVMSRQHSTYSVVEHTKFGSDSMEAGVDVLDAVYQNAITMDEDTMEPDEESVAAVHFFLLLLGEAPRSEVFKTIIFSTITTKKVKQCQSTGLVYDSLAKNWNKLCKCVCHLRLMVIEALMEANLRVERPNVIKPAEPHHTLVDLFKEMTIHKRKAQYKCSSIAMDDKLRQVYGLLKERGADGKYVYSESAYKNIMKCLSLIRYSSVVIGLMVREKPYTYPMFLIDTNDTSVKYVADELLFWDKYKSFEKDHKAAFESKDRVECECQYSLVMRFLPDTTPFLRRWGYSASLSIEEINLWCDTFKSKTPSMGEVPAGKFVIREWRKVNLELETKLKALIVFIGENYLGD